VSHLLIVGEESPKSIPSESIVSEGGSTTYDDLDKASLERRDSTTESVLALRRVSERIIQSCFLLYRDFIHGGLWRDHEFARFLEPYLLGQCHFVSMRFVSRDLAERWQADGALALEVSGQIRGAAKSSQSDILNCMGNARYLWCCQDVVCSFGLSVLVLGYFPVPRPCPLFWIGGLLRNHDPFDLSKSSGFPLLRLLFLHNELRPELAERGARPFVELDTPHVLASLGA
jgi:hypothetical protein